MSNNLICVMLTIIIIYGMYIFHNIKFIIPFKEKQLELNKEKMLREELSILMNRIDRDDEYKIKYNAMIKNLELREREIRTEVTSKKIINDITEISTATLLSYILPKYKDNVESFGNIINGSLIIPNPLTITANKRTDDLNTVVSLIDKGMSDIQKKDIDEVWMSYDLALSYIRDMIVGPQYDTVMTNIINDINKELHDTRMDIRERENININNIAFDEYMKKFSQKSN